MGQIQSQGCWSCDQGQGQSLPGAQPCKVLIGAHGVLNNAYIMSRIGTAMITAIAKAHNVQVLACFETYKISDRSQADSFVFNELGEF